MPQEQQIWCKQWASLDYEYNLWTDTAWELFGGFDFWVNKLNLKNVHPGITSDVLRALIVNKFGGLYIDTDIELIKDPTELLDTSFLCGFENAPVIMGGFFGGIKNHSILNTIINSFKPYGDDLERIGWKLFSKTVVRLLDKNCTVLGQDNTIKYYKHHMALSWLKERL